MLSGLPCANACEGYGLYGVVGRVTHVSVRSRVACGRVERAAIGPRVVVVTSDRRVTSRDSVLGGFLSQFTNHQFHVVRTDVHSHAQPLITRSRHDCTAILWLMLHDAQSVVVLSGHRGANVCVQKVEGITRSDLAPAAG